MYNGLDEQELARYCCQRDRLAENELYIRYAAKIFTLCRRYLGDDEKAKDLMQESFIQALDKIHTFKYGGKGSLYGWIRRIAINKALNQIKRQRWRTVPLDVWVKDSGWEPSEEDIEVVPEEKLLEWIAELPDMRRTVFNMYCIDGYSHKEIGKLLGISEKGSAGVLAKARRQLKERINGYLKEQDR